MRIVAAALLALTGENIVRLILDIAENPKLLAELLKIWRGK